ncbi:unnamed protein product [Lupinus luteus]|uniref:Serine/threonine specific protein phosphatases domain-containing protein n=1 Tax=Lupinus luteus TaxID=3873 RepID=A0AAV1XKC5_LUPLU
MDPHKERIKSGCHKILDGINSMSLVNLDDQQVHSLVMMKEIARGVVDDRDRKVSKNDVIAALRFSIEKMACASRDIIQLLSRMCYEGLDDQQMHSVLRMKELAHGIFYKQPRVAATGPDLLVDKVGFVDEGMRDTPMAVASKMCNKDSLINGAQSMEREEDILDVEHVLGFENDDCITLEWVQAMLFALEQATQRMLPSDFCHVMPTILVDKLINAACSILCKEPNCVEIDCQGKYSRVIVVGDIHGKFHDLLYLFKHEGVPSENQFYVFNGNYVDIGAWGIEVFLALLAWKLIIRSHEGPDARAGRDGFVDMLSGYSMDHEGESGKLYTLFSAPDYPQVDPYVDFDGIEMDSSQLDSSQMVCWQKLFKKCSLAFLFIPSGIRPGFDFGELGIYNAPAWGVELPDGSGGSQIMQVPRAPVVEGLPLPPNIQEPHKSAYEYLFELVGSLKHMIVARENENRARVSALKSRARKRKGKDKC